MYGQNLTIANTELKVYDTNEIDTNYYFITVDKATYKPGIGVYLTFTNCTIDIRGNFLQSNVPVNIVFDNCVFKVGNTSNLFTLDYSIGSQYGCSGDDMDAGDFEIRNSKFIDTSLPISSLINPAAA